MNRRNILLTAALIPSAMGLAQGLPQVDPKAAEQNLISKAPACYPPIAQLMNGHVHGEVIVGVAIGKDGKVAAAKVLSGPGLLQMAALRAAKQYEYKPFEQDGQAAIVATKVTISFALSPNDFACKQGDGAWRGYESLAKNCAFIQNRRNSDDQLRVCKAALDFASGAPAINHREQLIDARREYAIALVHAGRAKEAVTELNEAYGEARRYLEPNDPEYMDTIAWRGAALDAAGEQDRAAADYSSAEILYRSYLTIINHVAHDFSARQQLLISVNVRPGFKSTFSMVLKKHAALLEVKGDKAQATALKAEAAQIQRMQEQS